MGFGPLVLIRFLLSGFWRTHLFLPFGLLGFDQMLCHICISVVSFLEIEIILVILRGKRRVFFGGLFYLYWVQNLPIFLLISSFGFFAFLKGCHKNIIFYYLDCFLSIFCLYGCYWYVFHWDNRGFLLLGFV